jgi:SAM-dependent methyltransferase
MFRAPRKTASTPPAPASFNPLEEFRESFTLSGTVVLDRCPVCEGRDIARLWQLPQSALGAPTSLSSPGSKCHGYSLDHLPLLTTPQQVFAFDVCRHCHSIFRNPKDDDQAIYRQDRSKISTFKATGTVPFAGLVSRCEKAFPQGTRTVVDAACGAGQALALLRARHPEFELRGLELSRPSVDFIREMGIEAAVVDLDLDDLDHLIEPGSVDFIIFYEAFEHVRKPLVVLRRLVRLLRSGGRLHFSAQYHGPRSSLPIRVGEPIYLDRHGLDWVLSQLDASLHELVIDTKFRVTLERR